MILESKTKILHISEYIQPIKCKYILTKLIHRHTRRRSDTREIHVTIVQMDDSQSFRSESYPFQNFRMWKKESVQPKTYDWIIFDGELE